MTENDGVESVDPQNQAQSNIGCLLLLGAAFIPPAVIWPMIKRRTTPVVITLMVTWTVIWIWIVLIITFADPVSPEQLAQRRSSSAEREQARETERVLLEAREDAQEAQAEAQAAAEEEACRVSRQCLAERLQAAVRANSVDSRAQCQMLIESMARYDHDWTYGVFEQWYSRVEWGAPNPGSQRIIQYRGSALRLQNGFGAWSQVGYECEYDTQTRRAIDARIF